MTDDGRTARRQSRRGPDLRCRAGAARPAGDLADRRAGEGAAASVLEIDVLREEGGTALAAVRGEIDVQTADTLRDRLAALHAAGHLVVVLDFTAVPFCDAAGLGALVAAHNRVAERGGRIRLVGVRPAQRRLLRITGLHRLFPLYENVEDALAGRAPAKPAKPSKGARPATSKAPKASKASKTSKAARTSPRTSSGRSKPAAPSTAAPHA
ncbi:hypothetical protein GCM10023085_80150 [Actinomadura viridis]